MKTVTVKLLLNQTHYSMTDDLAYIKEFMAERGVEIIWKLQAVNLTGYSVKQVTNPFGNLQYVLTGAEPLVLPFIETGDDICALIIKGFEEFGDKCPSESEDKAFLPGTKTVFLSANADDAFYDVVPNFRIWLLHELMHALGTIASSQGFPVIDCMDVLYIQGKPLYYYYNQDPSFPNSNFINMFERLEKWIHS